MSTSTGSSSGSSSGIGTGRSVSSSDGFQHHSDSRTAAWKEECFPIRRGLQGVSNRNARIGRGGRLDCAVTIVELVVPSSFQSLANRRPLGGCHHVELCVRTPLLRNPHHVNALADSRWLLLLLFWAYPASQRQRLLSFGQHAYARPLDYNPEDLNCSGSMEGGYPPPSNHGPPNSIRKTVVLCKAG